MSSEDLEQYESDLELTLYKEYRDVIPMFKYVVETDRRSYLANDVLRITSDESKFVTYQLVDAWVWDMYRPSRFLKSVTVTATSSITVEELPEREDSIEEGQTF